jgi:hypothetical protein
MRRSVLLLAAAVPLVLTPPALADGKNTERPCQVPDIELSYDTETFTTMVSLPASGCASREHTQFVLSASISRLDNGGGRDVVERSAMCGPFRSVDDFDDGEAPRYFCNLAVFLDHPPVETAQYDVDVTYPGAGGERTTNVFTFCSSDGETATCEQ